MSFQFMYDSFWQIFPKKTKKTKFGRIIFDKIKSYNKSYNASLVCLLSSKNIFDKKYSKTNIRTKDVLSKNIRPKYI